MKKSELLSLMMKKIKHSFFSGALISECFKTIAFYDPVAAMKYISSCHSKFCLAIIDWKMSRVIGIEFAKIISHFDDKIMMISMFDYGVDHYLLKQIREEKYLKKSLNNQTRFIFIQTIKK